MSSTIYAGIDISKVKLDLCLLPSKTFETFENNKEGINKLIKYLKEFSPELVVLEATGGYEKELFSRSGTWTQGEKVSLQRGWRQSSDC